MDQIIVRGGKKLRGSVKISGSKNSSLPIFVTSLLTNDVCVLDNVPNLEDVNTMKKLLISLGVNIKSENKSLVLKLDNISSIKANNDLVRRMRASILVLGPLLAKFGEAEVSLPGGCALSLIHI